MLKSVKYDVIGPSIYLFNSWIIEESRNPRMTIPCSLSCFETSLADEPETSIQVYKQSYSFYHKIK